MPAKLKSSEIAASRRAMHRARDLYIDIYQSVLASLISTDEEKIKELTDQEVEEITSSAARIADASLKKIEDRFPVL